MKFTSRLSLAAFGVGLLSLAAVPSAQAQTAFAIAGGGANLIRFNVTAPTAASLVGAFNIGGQQAYLDSLDFRLNGVLYGYANATQTLYSVNQTTGALTAVATGTGTGRTNTFNLGMDFNPMIDRLRIVTDSDQNLVYNPSVNASPTVATNLAYAAGDINVGADPNVIDNAYTNMTPAFAGSTVQYGIDYGLDSLVTIANNAGTLTTVGSLGVNINDTQPFVGFDIYTTLAGTNMAYAILDTTTGNSPSLYQINLTTGSAGTAIGRIGSFTGVYGLAVTPSATAPEPGTLGLALLGSGTLVGTVVARRRKSS